MGLFKNKIDIENGIVYDVNKKNEIMNSINNNGYCTGQLQDKYGNKYYGKHEVIIAEALNLPKHLWSLDDKGKRYEINHKNKDRTDNRIENLELNSKSYNNTYDNRHVEIGKKLRNRTDLSKKVYKYTLDWVFVEEYPSASEAARQNNTYPHCIINCCNGGYYDKTKGYWSNLTVKGHRYSYERL